jgi:hypothetical protein
LGRSSLFSILGDMNSRRGVLLSLFMFLAMPFAGFGQEPAAPADSHEKFVDDICKLYLRVTAAMTSVQGVPSARKAAAEFKKLETEFNNLLPRAAKLKGTPRAPETQRKYLEQSQTCTATIQTEATRIVAKTPEGAEILKAALGSIAPILIHLGEVYDGP